MKAVTNICNQCHKFTVGKKHFITAIDSVGQNFGKDTISNSCFFSIMSGDSVGKLEG